MNSKIQRKLCTVDDNYYGSWLVEFRDGKTLLLQTDYDRASFAVDCGVVKAPRDWSGLPYDLPEDWWERGGRVASCPIEYYEMAADNE
jgi:hypothetical protein